jgi:hypothetical protein
MSDTSQGPGWWLASDGKWYAPELRPEDPWVGRVSDASQGDGWWLASDGRWYAPELHADYVASPQPLSLAAQSTDKHTKRVPRLARSEVSVPPSTLVSGPAMMRPPPQGGGPTVSFGAASEASGASSPPKKQAPIHKKWWSWAIAAVILIIAIAAVAGTGSKKNTPTPVPQKTSASAPATSAPTTTAAPVAPTKLQNRSGEGQRSLPRFTVPSSAKGWTLSYIYDCPSVGSTNAGIGNFVIDVTGYGSASVSTGQGPNEFGANGGATDTYDDTGTFSLDIDSDCHWTITVQTIPQ